MSVGLEDESNGGSVWVVEMTSLAGDEALLPEVLRESCLWSVEALTHDTQNIRVLFEFDMGELCDGLACDVIGSGPEAARDEDDGRLGGGELEGLKEILSVIADAQRAQAVPSSGLK